MGSRSLNSSRQRFVEILNDILMGHSSRALLVRSEDSRISGSILWRYSTRSLNIAVALHGTKTTNFTLMFFETKISRSQWYRSKYCRLGKFRYLLEIMIDNGGSGRIWLLKMYSRQNITSMRGKFMANNMANVVLLIPCVDHVGGVESFIEIISRVARNSHGLYRVLRDKKRRLIHLNSLISRWFT